jgi:hypothetical protein
MDHPRLTGRRDDADQTGAGFAVAAALYQLN